MTSRRSLRQRLDPQAARDAWTAFAGSRALVLAAAAFGAILFPRGPAPQVDPALAHPFDSWPLGGVIDFLLSPLVQWDAGWYLSIADDGYEPEGAEAFALAGRPAFFPLYPLLVRALGGFAGPAPQLIAASAISLAALLAALYLLHRLVELELGASTARAAVLLVAFCPSAYFFSAPYTESLFLLESVGAFYAARTGRWAAAGALGAAASATRNVGVLLIVPLALLYFRERPLRRPDKDVLWLALVPAGLIAYSLYLRETVGDPQAWRRAQDFFGRTLVDPLEGLRRGGDAFVEAVAGTAPDALRFPIMLDMLFLVFALVAIVGVFRLLHPAYGLYALALLLPAICAPYEDEPLGALPRYTLVVFPLFVWLAHFCERRGVTNGVVLASGALLALLAAGFATGQNLA